MESSPYTTSTICQCTVTPNKATGCYPGSGATLTLPTIPQYPMESALRNYNGGHNQLQGPCLYSFMAASH